jgi:predicted ester cyclase
VNIEDIIAEGDKVWVYLLYTMTHTGEFRGIAPTGKKITERSVYIFRIDGKITEARSVSDGLDFLKQSGLINTEKAKKLFPKDVK